MLARFSDLSAWPGFAFAEFQPARQRQPQTQNQLRRELDRLFGGLERAAAEHGSALKLDDEGANFVVRADVPGLSENDVQVSVVGNSVTVRGERKPDAPEAHSVQRRERSALRFARTFEAPARIDAERVTASIKHGVLTLTLPKAAEAQPRQINVKAA